MQENRSFDSYFGTFPGAEGLPTDGTGTSQLHARSAHGRLRLPVPQPEPGERRARSTTGTRRGRTSNGGRMDGFVRTAEQPGGRGCGATAPICASSAPPDVMGYHDAREIPNYWRWARDFTLQDHMFEPTASWSLPAHLFMVSGWSAHCTPRRRPDELRERQRARRIQTAQITGKQGADGPATNGAAALRARNPLPRAPRHPSPAVWARPARAAPARRARPVPPPGADRRGEAAYRVRQLRLDRPHLAHAPAPRELALLHPQGHRPREHARARRPRSGIPCRRSPTSVAMVRRATSRTSPTSLPPRVAGISPTCPGSFLTRSTRNTRPLRRRPGSAM